MSIAITDRLQHRKAVETGRAFLATFMERELKEAEKRPGGTGARLLVSLCCDVAQGVWQKVATEARFQDLSTLGTTAVMTAREWSLGGEIPELLEVTYQRVRSGFGKYSSLAAVMTTPIQTARYLDPVWLEGRRADEQVTFPTEGVAVFCELVCPNAATALAEYKALSWDEEQKGIFHLIQSKFNPA